MQVTAIRGDLRVTTAQGMTIAALSAGRALEFEVPGESGASPPALVTGCVVKIDGKYFLTDEAAGVTVELKGNVNQYAGRRVEVNGSQVPDAKPAAGASQVVQAGRSNNSTKSVQPCGRSGGSGRGGVRQQVRPVGRGQERPPAERVRQPVQPLQPPVSQSRQKR
jgi:hypothetical protein